MADLATMTAQLSKLQDIRAKGAERVRMNGEEVTFHSDAEIAAAIGDLESRISTMQGRTVRTVRFTTSKGL